VGIFATVSLSLCSVIWGRVGLHMLLNVLRSRRSAETLGGGLLVMLFGAAFVPPPDLSWIRDFNTAAPVVDDALLRGAIDVFTLLPTGGWGTALFFDANRQRRWVPAAFLYLIIAIVVGYILAYWLLARFHRRAARALPQRVEETKRAHPFRHTSLNRVLIERELRDLWLNPRTRMTLALPFFLSILLKLVGARALAAEFVGPLADAYLIGGVASYGAFVLAAGFSQNAFGYDGGGAQLLLLAPVQPRDVMRAKNLVHGGVALTLCLVLIAFYAIYIAIPPPWMLLLAVSNAAFQVLLFVALGNLLSILAPRKFHPSLKRRDRASALATSVGLGAASLAVMPALFVVRHADVSWALVASAIVLLPVLGWWLWKLSLPAALTLLSTRRAELLRAVARE
jgi:ABC-2 type transport system permease protein